MISEYEQREHFRINYKGRDEQLFVEVPVFGRSVDAVKWNSIDDSISAIEFKLYKWKKALEQVISIAIAFDYIEICVMEPKTEKGKNAVISECNKYGVGVYFTEFNENKFIIKHVLNPEKVVKTWEIQRSNIKNYLRGI